MFYVKRIDFSKTDIEDCNFQSNTLYKPFEAEVILHYNIFKKHGLLSLLRSYSWLKF